MCHCGDGVLWPSSIPECDKWEWKLGNLVQREFCLHLLLERAGVFPGFYSAVKISSSIFKILELDHPSSQLQCVVWIWKWFFHIKGSRLELEVICVEASFIFTFSISLFLFLFGLAQNYNCTISVNAIRNDWYLYRHSQTPVVLNAAAVKSVALNEIPWDISFIESIVSTRNM